MQTFKSKVDTWIVLVFIFAVGITLFAILQVMQTPEKPSMLALLIILLLGVGLPIWILVSTRYTIEKDILTIQSAFYRKKILLSEIKSIEPSNSLWASAALSLDRLMIHYGNGKRILVSPEDKDEFKKVLGFKTTS